MFSDFILSIYLYKRTAMKKKDLSPIHIDLTKTNRLDESFLAMFGGAIKMILKRMFGSDIFLPDMKITGSPQQVESFARALAGEKRYYDSYVRYGLNDPRTYQDRYALDNAVRQFENNTGLKWPYR